MRVSCSASSIIFPSPGFFSAILLTRSAISLRDCPVGSREGVVDLDEVEVGVLVEAALEDLVVDEAETEMVGL